MAEPPHSVWTQSGFGDEVDPDPRIQAPSC